MKYIEKVLYKIIVDIFLTIDKLHLSCDEINVQIFQNNKTNFLKFNTYSTIKDVYDTLKMDKTIDCHDGIIIQLDSIKLKTVINNNTVNY
jgi:hypothetical protein